MTRRAVDILMTRGGQPTGRAFLDGSKKVNRIGTSPTAEVQINDPGAGRLHAAIEISPSGVMLIDMGSPGGTAVNGARVSKGKLNDGDQITIGATTLTITFGDPALAGPVTPPAPAVIGATPGAQPAVPSVGAMLAAEAAGAPVAPLAAHQAPPAMPAAAAPPEEPTVPSPVDSPLQKSGAIGLPPSMLLHKEELGDHDDELPEDDPMVERMRRASQRNRRLVLLGIPVVAAVIIGLAYAASQQEAPDLPAQPTYGGERTFTPEQIAELARFDASEPRDEALYEYHRVNGRQTLREIATKLYGDLRLSYILVAANPKVASDTDELLQDQEIRIPKTLAHIVQEGDTLEKIAEERLKDPDRVPDIVKANAEALGDPPTLKPGMKLEIPLLEDAR